MYVYVYIYTERYAVRSPFFHVSGNAVFLLHHVQSFNVSYTCDGIARDPRRLSDFLRGCQRMSRDS